jgi:hypothetical protein
MVPDAAKHKYHLYNHSEDRHFSLRKPIHKSPSSLIGNGGETSLHLHLKDLLLPNESMIYPSSRTYLDIYLSLKRRDKLFCGGIVPQSTLRFNTHLWEILYSLPSYGSITRVQ